MNLEQNIEALLFYKGEPMDIRELSKLLDVTETGIKEALKTLEQNLKSRGLRLVILDSRIELRTAPEADVLITNFRKEELGRDLGRAGAETLSVVLYKGPATRAEVDFIRGVNSTFILRNLLIRGLVERIPNPKDQRSYLYRPTVELLAHLGITRVEELPQYAEFRQEFEAFEQAESEPEEENVV